MKITVLGAGSWGTALGRVLALKGNEVVFYDHNPIKESINTSHINVEFYPDIILPSNMSFEGDLSKALTGAKLVLFAVPSRFYRETAKTVSALLTEKVHIVSVAKGFDPQSFERLSCVLREEIPAEKRYPIVTLIGPSYAEEVIRDLLTCVTAVSLDEKEAKFIQDLFSNETFRVYTNTDEIGAEVCAAMKNVLAIAAGIVIGLGQGENARASLVTRGLKEIMRLGLSLGGKKETFYGLTGIGDLMLTCNSMKSRNFTLGFQIGCSNNAKRVLEDNKKTVEGILTCKYATSLCKSLRVEMPITEAIYKVLFENAVPSIATVELMKRELKSE